MLGFKTTNSRTSISAQSSIGKLKVCQMLYHFLGAKITAETGSPTSTASPLVRTKIEGEVVARRAGWWLSSTLNLLKV